MREIECARVLKDSKAREGGGEGRRGEERPIVIMPINLSIADGFDAIVQRCNGMSALSN